MKKLSTARTLLRPFEDEDYDFLHSLMTDAEIMKYTGFRDPQPDDLIQQRFSKWKDTAASPLGVLCAELKESGDRIGWFMLQPAGTELPEIGFMLSKDFWSQGYATEVALEILRHGFEDLGLKKIVARASPENEASISVLKKIGMSETREFKDPVNDVIFFRISRKNPK